MCIPRSFKLYLLCKQKKLRKTTTANKPVIRKPDTTMIGPSVKAEMKKPSPPAAAEFDQLVGDGLRIKKTDNKDSLWIRGDGCRIKLTTNSGNLRITGDGCRVKISRNLGSIEYNGDGGRIILGVESRDADNVTYNGVGGLIEFSDTKKSKEDKKSKKQKDKSAGGKGNFSAYTKIMANGEVGSVSIKVRGSNCEITTRCSSAP